MKILVIAVFCLLAGLAAGLWMGFIIGTSRTMRQAAERSMNPEAVRRRRQFAYRLFAVGGLVILVFAAAIALNTLHFVHTAVATSGRIIELRESTDKDGQKLSTPVFVFQDTSNASHRIRSSVSSSADRFRVGDQVAILYSPNNPDNASINTTSDVWGSSICLGALGGALLVFGLVATWYQDWRLGLKASIPLSRQT